MLSPGIARVVTAIHKWMGQHWLELCWENIQREYVDGDTLSSGHLLETHVLSRSLASVSRSLSLLKRTEAHKTRESSCLDVRRPTDSLVLTNLLLTVFS
jgi:hypothetical protein